MNIKILSALAAAMIATGCTSNPQFSDDPDDVTHDGLTKVNRTIMDAVYARKDIDLSGVTKVRFDGLGVQYRNVKGPYSGRAGVGSTQAAASRMRSAR